MPKEPCKIEQFWDKLCDRVASLNVSPWHKQPRQVQDAFLSAFNAYNSSGDLSLAYLVFSNASKGE